MRVYNNKIKLEIILEIDHIFSIVIYRVEFGITHLMSIKSGRFAGRSPGHLAKNRKWA